MSTVCDTDIIKSKSIPSKVFEVRKVFKKAVPSLQNIQKSVIEKGMYKSFIESSLGENIYPDLEIKESIYALLWASLTTDLNLELF